jgi:methylisocitrate lyase
MLMSKAEQKRIKLKALLQQGRTIIMPGAYDPVTAMLIERAGFPAVYIGSYATAAARLGQPDAGIVTMDEMTAHARSVADAVSVPVLADGENGWNNAANIWRTVRCFEQAGVCGIHIEDHQFGKHAPVPQVLATAEQTCHKIKAALDAREDQNFLIIGRTDAAWASNDVEEAVRRMNMYAEAGADLVMASGMSPDTLGKVRKRIKSKVVIVDTPGRSIDDEQSAGADIVLYYGFCLYAAYGAVKSALEAFKQTRTADKVPNLRQNIAEFEEFIGYPAFTERAKKYAFS